MDGASKQVQERARPYPGWVLVAWPETERGDSPIVVPDMAKSLEAHGPKKQHGGIKEPVVVVAVGDGVERTKVGDLVWPRRNAPSATTLTFAPDLCLMREEDIACGFTPKPKPLLTVVGGGGLKN